MHWQPQTVAAGTLTYDVNGIIIVKNVTRQSLVLDDYNGTYLGAIHASAVNCTNPADNAPPADIPFRDRNDLAERSIHHHGDFDRRRRVDDRGDSYPGWSVRVYHGHLFGRRRSRKRERHPNECPDEFVFGRILDAEHEYWLSD